jgi:hypothetical protein
MISQENRNQLISVVHNVNEGVRYARVGLKDNEDGPRA